MWPGECSVTLVSATGVGVEASKGLLVGPFKMLTAIVKGGSAIKLLRRLALELELGQIIHVGKKQGMPLNRAIKVAPNLLQEKLHWREMNEWCGRKGRRRRRRRRRRRSGRETG